MRPRQHLTSDQQYLAIARLQTGCSQTEVATELRAGVGKLFDSWATMGSNI